MRAAIKQYMTGETVRDSTWGAIDLSRELQNRYLCYTDKQDFNLQQVFEEFTQHTGLELDELQKMHIAEFCYITANHADPRQINQSMGGGGLTLDFRKSTYIKNLLENKEHQEEYQ